MKKAPFVLIIILSGFFLTNCKENIDEVQDTIYSAQDNSDAETHFFSAFEVMYDAVSTNGKMMKKSSTILPASVLVVFQDTSFDDGDGIEFTIDFGPLGTTEPKGVLCEDGRYRAGKMHIEASTKFIDPLLTVSVSLGNDDNYFTGNGTDMHRLTGNIKMQREGLLGIKTVFKDAKLIGSTHEITWNSTRVIEQIENPGPGIWGDVYQVTGEASGINRFGESYDVTITSPLIKKMQPGCAKTFVSGELDVTSQTNGNKTIRINYDPFLDQACDALAEAEISGRKTIFTVK